MDPFDTPFVPIGPALPHALLVHWRTIWKKCRDVLAGEEAVKRAGEEYLPKMSRMSHELYENYKMRAMFYGASQRTLQGLIGMLLSQTPTVYYTSDNEDVTSSLQNTAAQVSATAAGVAQAAARVASLHKKVVAAATAQPDENGNTPPPPELDPAEMDPMQSVAQSTAATALATQTRAAQAAATRAAQTQAAVVAMLSNITQNGSDLVSFTRDIAQEVLSVGRVGILVDAPPANPQLLDPIPYARFYCAENIINWREHFEGGVPILDQVILVEMISLPSTSGFGVELVLQYRELALNEDGTYVQRLWVVDPPDPEVKNSEATYRLIDEVIPTAKGKPLKRLPFYFCSSSHTRPEIERPPLLDLFNLNLSHYRSSADLEHGRHFTALPTPVVTGVDTNDDGGQPPSLEIGSSTAWLLPEGATARMLEFNGQGLKHLENALSSKESLMTNLGARMLEPDKRSSETAEALRLRQAGDIASLNTIADTMSEVLTRVVRLLAFWANITKIPDDPNLIVQLDKDYFETRLTPQMLSALVQAWQAGAMGFRDLYFNLLRGETVDPQRTYNDVYAEVQAEQAMRQSSIAVKPMQMTDSGTQAEAAS